MCLLGNGYVGDGGGLCVVIEKGYTRVWDSRLWYRRFLYAYRGVRKQSWAMASLDGA